MLLSDKKGQGISMTYIVIAALALIVLIVIFLFFTGGMERLFERQTETVESVGDEEAIWRAQCKSYCTMGQYEVFNKVTFGDEKKNCVGLGVKCDDAMSDAAWVEAKEVDMNKLPASASS